MSKKNKQEAPLHEKVLTPGGVDTMATAKYNAGVIKGMQTIDEAHLEEVRRLQRSFNDVWAVYYTGVITPEKQRIADQMTLLSDAIDTLVDVLADRYDTEITKYQKSLGVTKEEFWEGIHGEDTSWAS